MNKLRNHRVTRRILRFFAIAMAGVVAFIGFAMFAIGFGSGSFAAALGGILALAGCAAPITWFLIRRHKARQSQKMGTGFDGASQQPGNWRRVIGISAVAAIVGAMMVLPGSAESETTIEASSPKTGSNPDIEESATDAAVQPAFAAEIPEQKPEDEQPSSDSDTGSGSEEPGTTQPDEDQVEHEREAAEQAERRREEEAQAERDRKAADEKAAEVERERKAAEQAEREREAADKKAAAEKAAQDERDRLNAVGTSYKNCADVWARLGRPIRAGEPGYTSGIGKLDGNGDGVGCEKDPR